MGFYKKIKRKIFAGIIPVMILSSCGGAGNKDVFSEISDSVLNVVTSEEAKQAADDTLDYAKSLVSDDVKEDVKEAVENKADEIKKDAADAAKSAIKDAVNDAVNDAFGTSDKESSSQASDGSGIVCTIGETNIVIPYYDGRDYVEINDNIPFFTKSDYTTEPVEVYSEPDGLGRCGMAFANICTELMPTEERTSIGQIKPTGWVQNKYDSIKDVDNPAGYLYNRCHLIGFQLAGENANEKNLITGTRHFNTMEGMEQFENRVAQYVRSAGDNERHVLYRVTPVFEGDNLLATGVLMEAQSIEDPDFSFCVFVYNVEPGIGIDYSTGDNWQE